MGVFVWGSLCVIDKSILFVAESRRYVPWRLHGLGVSQCHLYTLLWSIWNKTLYCRRTSPSRTVGKLCCIVAMMYRKLRILVSFHYIYDSVHILSYVCDILFYYFVANLDTISSLACTLFLICSSCTRRIKPGTCNLFQMVSMYVVSMHSTLFSIMAERWFLNVFALLQTRRRKKV